MNDSEDDHDHGEPEGKLLLNSRFIYLIGEITYNLTGDFIAALNHLDEKEGDIHVIIASDGGWADGGFAMYDAIRSTSNKVITEACGSVGSAAVLPFLAGDIRLMNKNARMFLHQPNVTLGAGVPAGALEGISLEMNKLFNSYLDLMKDNSFLKKAECKKLCDDESYLSAKECLDMGFSDATIMPNKRKRTIKK